jgi:hypothetical protein
VFALHHEPHPTRKSSRYERKTAEGEVLAPAVDTDSERPASWVKQHRE